MSDQGVKFCKKFFGVISSTGFFALGLVYGATKLFHSFHPILHQTYDFSTFFNETSNQTEILINVTRAAKPISVFEIKFLEVVGKFLHEEVLGRFGQLISMWMNETSIVPLMIFFILFVLSFSVNIPVSALKLMVGHCPNVVQNLEIGPISVLLSTTITSSMVNLFLKIKNTDVLVFIAAGFITLLCSLVKGFSSVNPALIDSIFGGVFGLSMGFFTCKNYSKSFYSAVVWVFALFTKKEFNRKMKKRMSIADRERAHQGFVKAMVNDIENGVIIPERNRRSESGIPRSPFLGHRDLNRRVRSYQNVRI